MGSRADNERVSADEMDDQREHRIAYEYLCRLEEAKKWIESCIGEELPATTDLEDGLRNGVFLAKLANFFSPHIQNGSGERKIYDVTQARYMTRGLHFRHTDNINYWITAMKDIGLPCAILPETMDVYDRKNMPRVIYCLHALSMFLHSLGLAPRMHDLYGKVNFTEEEISAMRKELLKYGIEMPAFGTIGGILATEIPINEAALHAAIIAINEIINKDSPTPEELSTCLNNPAASLKCVESEAIGEYCKRLKSVKQDKSKECQITANLSNVVHDAYDELLTGTEIQDCLHDVNCKLGLESVLLGLDKKDSALLIKALGSSYLNMENIHPDNVEFYMTELDKVRLINQNNLPGESALNVDAIQRIIEYSNRDATIFAKRKVAIDNINKMLKKGDAKWTLTALQNPEACLPPVYEFAAELYQEEFTCIRNESRSDLIYEELNGGIIVLSLVANINLCVEAGDAEKTFAALCNEHVHIFGLNVDCKLRYQSALHEAQKQKTVLCLLLTHYEIQECVDGVNKKAEEENKRVIAIEEINKALKTDNEEMTIAALVNACAGIKNVDPSLQTLYHQMLLKVKVQKASASLDDSFNEDADLWIDEIQQTIDRANSLHSTAHRNCLAIAMINVALDKDDLDTLELAIQNPNAELCDVTPACLPTYKEALLKRKKEKSVSGDPADHFVAFKIAEGLALYLDANAMTSKWKPTETHGSNSTCLSRAEIQSILTSITSDYNYRLLCTRLEPQIVLLQACSRSFLTRNRFKQRFYFLHSQTAAVVKIQACWKGYRQRLAYKNRRAYLRSCIGSIIKVQSVIRMHLIRKKYLERLRYLNNQSSSVIKIQSFWRGNRARKAFQELTTAVSPSFSIVQQFVHLLKLNNSDFSEELELHRLRGEVVQSIRHNQQLEKDLNAMDVKIGLLVKNRITLEDVIAHGTKMNSKTTTEKSEATVPSDGDGVHQSGLKSSSNRECRLKMDACQHLFYALQTNPQYLSRLISMQLPGRVIKFMESFIFTLFNYASNQREEYLLLKLFKNALQDEISNKLDHPHDLIAGNPNIIKMIVGFHRSSQGQGSLREILGPLVKQVLSNKDLHINTNPVDIYKSYINQLETDSGQPSDLSYNVTQTEALQHEKVRTEIESSIATLKEYTLLFFNTIVASLDKIPYGILYMAKVMKTSLGKRFPDAPEKDLLKVIGHLLYYRYINSAIVAPDAFDIVDIGANESLTSVQRTNLGSVAKILQFSTSKTGFDDESPHLISLNPFIVECHEKFKKFFCDACNVPELEEHFKVNEYTEATMLTKPVIFISLHDIFEVHSLLLEHQNSVAPDAADPLHELLEDLGSKPSVEALIGENPENITPLQMAKLEVCLFLNNKFELSENSKNATNTLFVRTKQMLVDIMRCSKAANLIDMINSKPTEFQRTLYRSIIAEKELHTCKEAVSYRTRSDKNGETLDETIENTMRNLNLLELEGYVSSKNNYADIVKAIALEIRNRHGYRIRRRKDLDQLKVTLANLQKKTTFCEEQVDYYNQYMKQCLANMTPGSKKLRRGGSQSEEGVKSMSSRKYTALKLHEKGVIVAMEGLALNQFKKVVFEITPTEVAGVFVILVKYMGTNLSQVELDIQDLLELQSEGIPVTRLFDRAEVNVNLLLFLLNREFYGKSR